MQKECVAMLLAGGHGSRLGVLTSNLPKPAVHFGGKYRIIDFALSNCSNSGIDIIGVLTQYKSFKLNSYIGIGQPWDLDSMEGGVYLLSPFVSRDKGEWYKGTANAIYQNIEFIDQYNPKYVLILSGDHIYNMNYNYMLEYHKQKGADATIAVLNVPYEDAGRFGVINSNINGEIYSFQEKPKVPKSNCASMGIYVFNWNFLRDYLLADEMDQKSTHDFGKDIIPKMLDDKSKMYSYTFEGYWKDVGTIESFWEANMDLIKTPTVFDINDPNWKIYSRHPERPPHYISKNANVKESLITDGSIVCGKVENSVIYSDVYIENNAEIKNSIILPGTKIGAKSKLSNVIIGEKSIIGSNCELGSIQNIKDGSYPDITIVGENINLPDGFRIGKGMVVDALSLDSAFRYKNIV